VPRLSSIQAEGSIITRKWKTWRQAPQIRNAASDYYSNSIDKDTTSRPLTGGNTKSTRT
jgi:hypothetical protein